MCEVISKWLSITFAVASPPARFVGPPPQLVMQEGPIYNTGEWGWRLFLDHDNGLQGVGMEWAFDAR